MIGRGPRAVLLATLVVLGSAGCRPASELRGVLLITLDTTRADRLGCYGYAAAETPRLDALAAEGTLFLEAHSPVPVTLPAHATLFTGNQPPVHGVRYNGMFRLGEASVTLAELLRDAGWSTVGVPSSFTVTGRTGLDQGFATYHDEGLELAPGQDVRDAERSAAETTDLGVRLLREAAGDRERPFLLWLHYWDPHDPYEPPFPFSSKFRDRPYDGEIAYVDRELGRLFDAARDAGVWDGLLVVVAGDHGEGLYEHGERFHANLVYQTTLHVPLLVRAPGAPRGHVVREPVSLADVAPTVLEFAGLDGPPTDGTSLVPAIRGDGAPARPVYFESLTGSLVYGWSPLEGVRSDGWKYTRASTPELYDLREDPGELRNLYASETARAEDLDRLLDEVLAGWAGIESPAATTSTPLDPAELELLASLGYVGGSLSMSRRDGPHPKDLIHLDREMFVARDRMADGADLDRVLARLERVLEEDPTNRWALRMAARAALGAGDEEQALVYAARAVKIYPEFAAARVLQGELLVKRGELERAAAVFREGVEHAPDDSGLNYRLAVALFALDRPDESKRIAERMIAAGNVYTEFHVLRAACLAKLGEPDAALEALRVAIAQGYRARDVLETEPLLAPLRALPGFDEALLALPTS